MHKMTRFDYLNFEHNMLINLSLKNIDIEIKIYYIAFIKESFIILYIPSYDIPD